MSRYLEEAAALIRKAAEDDEHMCGGTTKVRLECAQRFAELAAIEKGLLPDRLAAKYVAEGYSAR
ncbi:hypothetical protein [Saccharopolyspora hattusasensis]|uniref:hypothetical protein n=1 Tax=Saccharopolyspora hattusasensis TaxID=1128679 RepID=UPI003D983F35